VTVNKSVTIEGGYNATVQPIDWTNRDTVNHPALLDGTDIYQILVITGTNNTVVLDGLTLQNGPALAFQTQGSNNTVTLRYSTVQNYGSLTTEGINGVQNGADNTLNIEHSTVRQFKSLRFSSAIDNRGTLKVSNSSVIDNRVPNSQQSK